MVVLAEFALVMVLGVVSQAYEIPTLRICGKGLADALALVCKGRGYNTAFRTDHAATPYFKKNDLRQGGRYKRGIVDDCCKKLCSLKTLESYCNDQPTKDTLQISKRSDVTGNEEAPIIFTKEDFIKRSEYALKNNLGSSKGNQMRHHKGRFLPVTLSSSSEARNHQYLSKRGTGGLHLRDSIEHFLGLHLDEPIDTSEIMAEVVHTSGQVNHIKKKRSGNTKNSGGGQIGQIPPYYLGRPLIYPSLHKAFRFQ